MSELKFTIKPGSRIKGKADRLAGWLQGIQQKRGLTPKNVVKEAAAKNSVGHGYFEWNDKKAGAAFRENQARHLIDSVAVQFLDGDQVTDPVRAFVAVGPAENRYLFISVALERQDTRESLLKQAFSELSAFSRKYRHLSELAAVFAAADKATTEKVRAKAG